MNTVIVKNCKTLFIGRRGENEVTEVLFDFSEWQEQFGAGVIDLYVKRNLDIDAYPVVLSVDGTVATWLVSAADTDVVGNGKIEYVYTVNEKIAKSAIFQFFVGDDIGESSPEPPEHYQSWLEQLTELGAETQANAQAAAQSASEAAESASEAAESASEAAESAAQVAEDSNNAEAWAVGERNGEPVSEGDPTYDNNAKYWAENARANAPVQSVNGEDGYVVLTLDDIPNGETYVRTTPEQLAQIATNSDDIADVKATADTALQPDDLRPYRTAAAQDAIDQSQNTMIGIAIQGKQAKITASGILKGDGAGGVSSAVAGTDYATPQQVSEKYTKPSSGIPSTDMTAAVQASLIKADTALQAVPDTYRTAADQDLIDNGKQAKITASGILKGDGAGGVSAAVAGVDYLKSAPVTSVNGQTGDVTIQTATDAQVTTAVNTWLGENVAQETGYVLDDSLTMSNAAPPASAVGDLKSQLTFEGDIIGWEYGAFKQNGSYTSTVTKNRLRLTRLIGKEIGIVSAKCTEGFEFAVYGYNADQTSIGALCTDGYFRTSGGTIAWVTDYNFANYSTGNFFFKLALRSAIDPNAELAVTDYINCLFETQGTDRSLNESGKAADAKATGEAIEANDAASIAKNNSVKLNAPNGIYSNLPVYKNGNVIIANITLSTDTHKFNLTGNNLLDKTSDNNISYDKFPQAYIDDIPEFILGHLYLIKLQPFDGVYELSNPDAQFAYLQFRTKDTSISGAYANNSVFYCTTKPQAVFIALRSGTYNCKIAVSIIDITNTAAIPDVQKNLLQIFDKITSIGDSLMGGYTGSTTPVTSTEVAKARKANWISYIGSDIGREITNLAVGSTSWKNWRYGTANANLEGANIDTNCYLVGLGVNDSIQGNTVGSTSDIAENKEQNGDSVYGNADFVIRTLHEYNENAHIFVFTSPISGTNSDAINEAIRYISSIYSYVHCIDIDAIYRNDFRFGLINSLLSDGLHYEPLGYRIIANYIAAGIDSFMLSNYSLFMRVPYEL